MIFSVILKRTDAAKCRIWPYFDLMYHICRLILMIVSVILKGDDADFCFSFYWLVSDFEAQEWWKMSYLMVTVNYDGYWLESGWVWPRKEYIGCFGLASQTSSVILWPWFPHALQDVILPWWIITQWKITILLLFIQRRMKRLHVRTYRWNIQKNVHYGQKYHHIFHYRFLHLKWFCQAFSNVQIMEIIDSSWKWKFSLWYVHMSMIFQSF